MSTRTLTGGIICPCDAWMVVSGTQEARERAMAEFLRLHEGCAPGFPNELAQRRFERTVAVAS